MNIKYVTTLAVEVYLSNAKVTKYNTENIYEGDEFNRSGRRHTMEGTATYLHTATNTEVKLEEISALLNSPQGSIYCDWEGTGVVGNYVLLASQDTDTRNGPLVNCVVNEIVGSRTKSLIVVSFSFTFFSCGDSRIQRFAYTRTTNIDQAGYMSITHQGTLVISTFFDNTAVQDIVAQSNVPTAKNVLPFPDVAGATPNSPDLYRNLVAPFKEDHYVRERQEYAIDSSHRTLTFNIVDKLVFRDVPNPVLIADGSYTYERSIDNPLGTKTFTVKMESSPIYFASDILAIAYEACQARIQFTGPSADLIQSMTVKEPNLYTRNAIELTVVALGTEADLFQPTLIHQFFNPLHTATYSGGRPKTLLYSGPYGTCGSIMKNIMRDKYDPCTAWIFGTYFTDLGNGTRTAQEAPITIFEVPADLDAKIPLGKGIETDVGMPVTAGIIHIKTKTSQDTQSTGMAFLETCGGSYQFPMQLTLPKVFYHQSVEMVSTKKNVSIPWDTINEPCVLVDQNISISGAAIDTVGNTHYCIVATRTLQVQAANSINLTRVSFDGAGIPRAVYATAQMLSPRTPYTKSLVYSTLTDANNHGTGAKSDYIG